MIPKLKNWSLDNLVNDAIEPQFILHEENTFQDVTKASTKEATELQELNNENNQDNWNGPTLWMRLCHFIIEEMALILCRVINDQENRQGTDGRNSSTRLKTFCEECANKFNDPF